MCDQMIWNILIPKVNNMYNYSLNYPTRFISTSAVHNISFQLFHSAGTLPFSPIQE